MPTFVDLADRSRLRLARTIVALLLLVPLCGAAQVLELTRAQRLSSDGSVDEVSLPDRLVRSPSMPGPLRATYRFEFDLSPVPHRLTVCMPGLIAHARIRFNGHVIDNRLDHPLAPLPRALNRIRLIEVPEEFQRAGRNDIEIDVAGPDFVSVSQVNVGARDALNLRYEKRAVGAVIGPAVVAVFVGSLGLCLLLLWMRRRDSLFGFFGLGTLAWALHTLWSVSPHALLPGIHDRVWSTALQGFVAAMLVTFCLRLAGWRRPLFVRALCLVALCGPLWLYAGHAVGQLELFVRIWMVGFAGVAGIGVVAVGAYALKHRNVESMLLLLTGVASLGFALRDWLVMLSGNDNNPVYLMPYAALLFVVLAVWMLIDRFVNASRALEALNSELERRVDAKSAQLMSALGEMRSAKDSAEAASRAKSSFLAAASHDLRQPIHALGLFMAALGDDHLSQERREIVQRMRSSLAAMESMFNVLLDVSRMDAGAVIPRTRAFALEPLLRRLAATLGPRAAELGLRLSVRIAPAPPLLYAFSDPVLVERVVLNLLGNAVKYTRSGGVLLSCRHRRAMPGGAAARWLVEVWDTGPGIAEADRELVFEEFYQVGNPERDRAGGLGLGLSIVRRVSTLLGLKLELHSVVGRGTRFKLELPCTADEPSAMEITEPGRSIAGLVVAVVDDDPEVREGMDALLRRWGCRVHTGADAAEVLRGLQASGAGTVQAIVADFRLRDGHTGVDAIEVLQRAAGAAVPAVIVSGDSSPEQLLRMQRSGFTALSKPVAPAALRAWLEAVAQTVAERQASREERRAEETVP